MTLGFRTPLIIFALWSVLLSGCTGETKSTPAPPVVKTMRVTLDQHGETRTYTGVIHARHEVQEAFRVGGRMEKRLVDVGDRVAKDQTLATLDEKDLRLSLESSQAELKAATANLEKTATDEQRYAKLLAKHVVSQAEYDLKLLAADEAKGRLGRAKSALKLAERQLDYAALKSSADGIVTKVLAEPGQVVSQGQTVVVLAYQGEMEVLVDIPESRLQDVKSSNAEVSLWSNQESRYRAVLRETAPNADATTRTYAMRFSLPDADASVRLGMTATLYLANEAHLQTARIPSSALYNQGQGPGVWVVDPNTSQVSLRPVTVERYADKEAYVSGRLADGEVIVTSGVYKLDDKARVRLLDPSQGNPK